MGYFARKIRTMWGLTGEAKLKAALTKCLHNNVKKMVYGYKCMDCEMEAVWMESNKKNTKEEK
jgi:hypothetical protein